MLQLAYFHAYFSRFGVNVLVPRSGIPVVCLSPEPKPENYNTPRLTCGFAQTPWCNLVQCGCSQKAVCRCERWAPVLQSPTAVLYLLLAPHVCSSFEAQFAAGSCLQLPLSKETGFNVGLC